MGALPSSSFPEIGSALGGWFSVCTAHTDVEDGTSHQGMLRECRFQ